MGSPLGPTLANDFPCYFEKIWLQNCLSEFKPVIYRCAPVPNNSPPPPPALINFWIFHGPPLPYLDKQPPPPPPQPLPFINFPDFVL